MTNVIKSNGCPERSQEVLSSEKIYVKGSLYPIEVGMRSLKLSRTYLCNGQEFASLPLYDTSGPYSDYSLKINPEMGLPPIRNSWNFPRKVQMGSAVTQMYFARKGIITPEMEYVALRENQQLEGWITSFSRGKARVEPITPVSYTHLTLPTKRIV